MFLIASISSLNKALHLLLIIGSLVVIVNCRFNRNPWLSFMESNDDQVPLNPYDGYLKSRQMRSSNGYPYLEGYVFKKRRDPRELVKSCGRLLMDRAKEVCRQCHVYDWKSVNRKVSLADQCCKGECSDNQIATTCCVETPSTTPSAEYFSLI
uniref:Insulin-like domain-containing protein n=1 Tax=Strongyloides venezuelensis TaxID=75913 RepID=A0A0K0FDZ5_STRVS